MNRHPTTTLNGSSRRRFPDRPLELYASPPDDRTAAAMDDAAAAQQLIDDLVALVDAGLVVPIDDDGEIRYAATDEDERDAA